MCYHESAMETYKVEFTEAFTTIGDRLDYGKVAFQVDDTHVIVGGDFFKLSEIESANYSWDFQRETKLGWLHLSIAGITLLVSLYFGGVLGNDLIGEGWVGFCCGGFFLGSLIQLLCGQYVIRIFEDAELCDVSLNTNTFSLRGKEGKDLVIVEKRNKERIMLTRPKIMRKERETQELDKANMKRLVAEIERRIQK